MQKRKSLQVPILKRQDAVVIDAVSKAMNRKKADAARILFYEAYARLQVETPATPVSPIAQAEAAR